MLFFSTPASDSALEENIIGTISDAEERTGSFARMHTAFVAGSYILC